MLLKVFNVWEWVAAEFIYFAVAGVWPMGWRDVVAVPFSDQQSKLLWVTALFGTNGLGQFTRGERRFTYLLLLLFVDFMNSGSFDVPCSEFVMVLGAICPEVTLFMCQSSALQASCAAPTLNTVVPWIDHSNADLVWVCNWATSEISPAVLSWYDLLQNDIYICRPSQIWVT